MILRSAAAADVPELVARIPSFFPPDALAPRPDPTMVEAMIRRLCGEGVILMLEAGPDYLGSLALELAHWEWAPGAYLRDRWQHVERGGFPAYRLLVRGARAVAERQGVPLYLGDMLSGTPRQAARKMALATRLGGRVVGGVVRFD